MPYVESFNATCDWNAWALVLDLDTREKVEGPVTVVLDPSTSAPSRGRQEAGDSQL